MVNNKRNVIIAAILSVCCILSAIYVSSCSKPKSGPTCNNYRCQNGGYCSVDTFYNNVFYPHDYNSSSLRCNCDGGITLPHCNCPAGYEGTYCENSFVAKYLRVWDVRQTVIGSDSANIVGKVSTYPAYLLQSATPTTFFINNICDSSNYNNIICTIDSNDSHKFVIDTMAAFHMFYQHFKFTKEGVGSISTDDSTITATIWTRHLNYNVNWQNDTLKLVLTPHHQ